MEETQYPSHNVDSSVGNVTSCMDLSNVAIAMFKLDRFGKLSSNTLAELWGGIEIAFPGNAIELCKGDV